MDRVRVRLEKLEQRVVNGRLKAPEKIGAAAARILARNHVHRYYGWAYEDGVFRFFAHPVHFTREQACEGKYVIQTEEQNLSAVDAVRLYEELSEAERAFADLKDVLDMRPIYHQAAAQTNLDLMYENGQGVPQHGTQRCRRAEGCIHHPFGSTRVGREHNSMK